MRRPFARPLAAALALVLVSVAAHAAGARFWQAATLADFLKGDVENLSIDMHGRLVLGPALTVAAETSAPFLWTMVAGPDGSTFVGTGNEGQVLRIAADGTTRVFFDAEELEVHALAPAPGGGLYVGTSPDGKIYKVDAAGSSSVLFDPADKYIWALATDGAGRIYAATGDKGVVYRITPDGKGEVLYETKAGHARTLAIDARGNVLVGTESPGRVFRIGADGDGFLLLDSGLQEVSALHVDPSGVVYAAAVSGRAGDDRPAGTPAPEPTRTPVPSVSTEITAVAIVGDSPSAQTGAASRPERRGPTRGAIYRILPDGIWDSIWQSTEDTPYDVALETDGALLVATGSKGKIYRLSAETRQATLVARAPAQQVTTLLRAPGRPLLATTSNPGKLLRLSEASATRGTYESEVRDADTVASWGAISWRGTAPAGTSVSLFTRSGNTQAPDETWSNWSAAYRKQDGEQITSPKARYLQWKAELTGTAKATPLVTSVTVAYLQRNLRPEITSITVHQPGVVFQKPFSTGDAEIAGFDGTTADRRAAQAAGATPTANQGTGSPALGRRGYQKGLQTIIWKAEDANDDELVFDVLYRREGETTWKALKRGLADPLFVWDTTSVPNGTYVLKITASDMPGNPPGSALAAERESQSVDVDNAPPAITVGTVRRQNGRITVPFSVRDQHSPVQRVEYSLDADKWRPIYPKDGIADSRSEEFELELDGDAGDRAVILRASDAMNNVATAEAAVPRR